MTVPSVSAQRLHNQHLLEELLDPVDALFSLTAVQSQDFAGGKWALGLRCRTTDAEIGRQFDGGKILRTHILRPTWHFVSPEDIRWIQALTGPRVHAFNSHHYRKLELDESVFRKSAKLLTKILRGGNQLTKAQLSRAFADAGMEFASGLRLTYVIMHAELEALICSGAMQGKQHTYALVEDRAPQAKTLPRDAALAELTRRFFAAHGPAQISDFSWWSSLTVADARRGIEFAGLKPVEIDGKTYYSVRDPINEMPSPVAHLLPNYDEFFIAYRDRTAFSARLKPSRLPSEQVMSYHLLAIDGQMAGGWKRSIRKDEYVVALDPFASLSRKEQAAVSAAAKRLSEFAGLPVRIEKP